MFPEYRSGDCENGQAHSRCDREETDLASKYYVIKKGRKTGIFNSWAECKSQIDGFSGAVYKSFKTESEAKAYLSGDMSEGSAKVSEAEIPEDAVIAYVDGSYNIATEEFSYGMVILRDGEEICFSEKVEDKSLASMRNVAGEIKGSEAAMRYALEENINTLVIYHDYEGIARWCLGDWKANKAGTIAYKKFYDSVKDRIDIRFVKVKGHSNDKYNDMADELAKRAVGIY